jgi:macrolide-specific efflux system membrane fusion protein
MKKKSIIIVGVIVVVAAAAIWYFFFKTKALEYKESQIKKASITLKILATGTVQPENRLQIKSSIAGRAEQVLVKEGQRVGRGQVLAWISSTERSVLLDSARAGGAEELKKWEDVYKPTPVIAPLGGTIILRSIEPGQTFSTSDVLFALANRLTVKAQVDETDLSKIQVGQKAQVTLDAYLDKNLDAKVSQVAYEAKTTNNVTTYTIEVLPTEKIEFLRSGMTANVTFYGETKEDILVIPNEFIKYENGKPDIQVKTENKPESREVKLGMTDGKKTEILSGLDENEIIVLLINNKDRKAKNNMLSGPNTSGKRR